MISSLIRASLRQRLLVMAFAVIGLMFGLRGVQNLSVDAFPDVTNIQVQIATEATGKSPDEVERLITVPIEIAMTGLPGIEEMRSLNKNGLSLITLVFNDDTDVYFARQLVMERMIEVKDKLPQGVTPVLGPVSTGLGEIYQYTLHTTGDDKAGELSKEALMARRTVQDWVVRPLLRGIPGVAEINSQGGYQREYHVLADPTRLMYYQIGLADVLEALEKNNANAGGGILQQHAEQYLVRGLGLIEDLDDIGNIVLKEVDGIPIYVKDVAKVEIGHAVRVGAVIQNGTTEAVGGIVLMLRGGNAKEVVSRIQDRVKEINDSGMLPDGLKIVPYYDRSELVDAALLTVIKVLLEAIVFVIIIVVLFLGDLRSSLIVVGTLLLTPLITFFIMNEVDLSANLMSLGGLAIAIGLMVDGSVVVVENAYARLGDPANKNESRLRVIFNAASEVATPVVFGVGIIILVFLPLMTLEGMEGKMFAPLAYTIAQSSLAKALTLADSLAKQIPQDQHWLVCHQADWLLYQLSGQLGFSDENNCLKLGYDPVLQQWEKATLELIGQAHLPNVVAPATLIGDLKEALRERWQLPTSTQLASGTTDSIAAFLATGASMPGDAVISLGSTLAFKLLTHQPYFDAEKGIYSHRLWNQWLVGGASNAGGACLLEAFELSQLQLLAQQPLVQPSPVPDYYPLPSQRCGERFPVNDPHLCAPSLPHTLDASERFSTLVHGLVAIEQLGWQRLSEGCEQPITRLYACGGGNKNPAWAGLRKATLDMPQAHPLSEQAAVGAAMLALRSLSNMTSV